MNAPLQQGGSGHCTNTGLTKANCRIKAFTRRAKKLLGLNRRKTKASARDNNVYSTTTAAALPQARSGSLLSSPDTSREVVLDDGRCEPRCSPRSSGLSPAKSDVAESACRSRTGLPQASSFYDENVGLRSPFNVSSPMNHDQIETSYSPAYLKSEFLSYLEDDALTRPDAGRCIRGPWESALQVDVDFESSPPAKPTHEPSLSHLQEVLRYGEKSLRSSQLATKVFGITELLEAILLAASIPRPNEQGKPMSWLYPLQRVNKSFAATIEGSLKLKQSMWLAQSDGDSGKDWALDNQPLGWLFKGVGIRDDITCTGRREGRRATGFTADYTIKVQIRDYRVQTLLARLKTSPLGASYGRSTWRTMHTCKWHVPPTIRFEFQYVADTAYDTLVPLRRHDRIHWVLDERKTLGDVYDVFKQMLQTYDDYRARRDEIESIRARDDKQREDALQQALRRITGN